MIFNISIIFYDVGFIKNSLTKGSFSIMQMVT